MTSQTHTTNAGNQADNTASCSGTGQFETLISKALGIHKSQLEQRLSAMLENADLNLITLLQAPEADPDIEPDDQTESDTERNKDYYEKLVRTLHAERDNIENSFFSAINANSGHNTHRLSNEPASNSGLSLIDQNEMDEMVAVTATFTNAMNRYGEEVNNLLARLEYLENSSQKTLPKHVFDLRHICEAFQSALTNSDFPTAEKLLLFKLFEQDVSVHLGEMYKSVNQLFIDAGVLPEVVYKVNSQASTARSTTESSHDDAARPDDAHLREETERPEPGAADSGKNASESGETGSSNALSRFLSKFMSGFGTARGEGIPESFSAEPSGTDSDACYSRDDLMGSLSKMQNNLADADLNDVPDIDTEHIKREMIANMGRETGGAITKTVHNHDQRCIDFVGMIFREIAEDESIPMVITNLLMLLQIPLIKTAIVDESLFTEEEHPARMTLDLITRAGRGVTEVTDSVFGELKSIVYGVLQNYDVDRSAFETAVGELQTLIRREEEIAAENEKNEQREIIKQHARNVVLGEMRLVTKGKIIPESARPLMLKHWPTLMFNRYINNGMESDEWLSSLKTFSLLMRHLQPLKSRSQWLQLEKNHEHLIETVNDQLSRAQKDREEVDAQVSALQQTFLDMLNNSQYRIEEEQGAQESVPPPPGGPHGEADADEPVDETPDDAEHDDKAARIGEQARAAREKISRLPSNVHPGVWFEIFDGKDRPVRRLKLSVVFADAAQLVFVDRQGIKVIEKDVDDFLTELANNQSRFIADHSTFERALGSVIHTFAG